MAVDPAQLQGLPPGQGMPSAGIPTPGDATQAPGVPGPPAAPLPTSDPNSFMQVIQAIMAQDLMTFQQQQDASLGTAVTQLLRQVPNQAGIDASSGPPPPAAPVLPGDPNSPPGGTGSGY